MNDSTLEAISKLKNGNNDFLLGDLSSGVAPMLLGADIIVDNSMPNLGAGNVPIIYGAVRELFVVRHTAPRIEMSRDAKWDEDMTSFRAVMALDSHVLDSAAIKKVTNAAS